MRALRHVMSDLSIYFFPALNSRARLSYLLSLDMISQIFPSANSRKCTCRTYKSTSRAKHLCTLNWNISTTFFSIELTSLLRLATRMFTPSCWASFRRSSSNMKSAWNMGTGRWWFVKQASSEDFKLNICFFDCHQKKEKKSFSCWMVFINHLSPYINYTRWIHTKCWGWLRFFYCNRVSSSSSEKKVYLNWKCFKIHTQNTSQREGKSDIDFSLASKLL